MAASKIRLQGGDIDYINDAGASIFKMTVQETSVLNIGNSNIKTSVTSFDNSNFLVTKQYVDNVARGLDVKESCRFATTANFNVKAEAVSSNELSIDMDRVTQSLVMNDRVLVKDQTNKAENGIYRYDGTKLVRAADFNATTYITKGAFTFVFDGSENSPTKNTGFAVSALGNGTTFTLDGTAGTGDIIFTVISSQADNYKDASTINTGFLDSAHLQISAAGGLSSFTDGVGIKSAGVTNSMIVDSTIANGKLASAGRVPFTTTPGAGLAGSGITVTNNTTSGNLVLGQAVNFSIDTGAIESGMISNLDGAKIDVDSIANTSLVNKSVTINAGSGLQTSSAVVALGSTAEVSIANEGVDTIHIKSAAVTNAKLANSGMTITTAAASGLEGGGTKELGSTFALAVKTAGIVTTMIADDAVTNDKIATPQVSINTSEGITGGGQVALGGSLSLKIVDGGVSTAKIAAAAVTNDKLANSGLTLTAGSGLTGAGALVLGASHSIAIATGGVTNVHVNDVSGAKLIAATVPNTALTNDNVRILPKASGGLEVIGTDTNNLTMVKLGDTIDVGIKSGGVINSMIANGVIANDKLVNRSVSLNSSDGILVNTSTSHTLELGASTTISILDKGITGDKIADSTITNGNLVNKEITLTCPVASGLEITGSGKMTLGSTGTGGQSISISALGVSNEMLKGSIANAKLVNSSVTVNAGTGLSGGGGLALGGSITINAAQDISPTAEVTFASITASSDPRLKANMTILENCDDMVDVLNPYSFNWKQGTNTEALQYGLNADEVESVNADLVKVGENGFKSVNYNAVIAILLGAVKELKKEVAELKSKM